MCVSVSDRHNILSLPSDPARVEKGRRRSDTKGSWLNGGSQVPEFFTAAGFHQSGGGVRDARGGGCRLTAPVVSTTSGAPLRSENHFSAMSRNVSRNIVMAAGSCVLSAEWCR